MEKEIPDQELARHDFDTQVRALIAEHGAAAFAAPWPGPAQRTLFVDGQIVRAEAADSPRHRYGAFYELDEPLASAALDQRVIEWIQTGEAYEVYLGMNVCRYHCG